MSDDVRGALLRSARLRSGLTLQQLADAVGVSAATLSRAETGRTSLTAERLNRCARALAIDPAMLVEGGVGDVVMLADEPKILGVFVPEGVESWRAYPPLGLDPALQAALQHFLELGYHGTSVRDLAKRAGLSVPGLYHYYPRKEDLLVAVMDLTMNDFRNRCEAARAEGVGPKQRFDLLVECYALFHTYRRELAFIGASEMRSLESPHRERISEIRVACQRMVTEEIAAMADLGQARVDDPEDVARAVVSMLIGIANWYRADRELTPEGIARRYVAHARSLVNVVPS